ncbi:flagellin [Thalassovita sp.]|uniref:flagellin n=1 Tax=Thalassovita sp. TaxID=1979401 RepID=UPI002881C4CB|nr:flagellin [Thalassovita sp.]MDF1802011.1 flagellin [Thalassovita sp.]
MKLVSMGDMAQTWALRQQNMSLNAELSKLTQELSSGTTSNLSQHLNGDFRYLADIEHRTRTAQAYETATNEAQGFATTMQAVLGSIQTGAEQLASDLLTASEGTQQTWNVLSQNASERLSEIVASLNTSFAGRSLFAGDETGMAAMASSDDILTSVRIAVAGEVTADGIRGAVEDWFSSETGFGAVAYIGSDQNLSPFRLGERDAIQLDLRADAEELRSVMGNVVLAAISTEYSDPDLQVTILEEAGLALLEDQDGLTAVRADLGFAQARIEEIGTSLAAERLSLSYARESLIGVDEFQTATELENVQFHLQALYSVTARLSGLSLVNFL